MSMDSKTSLIQVRMTEDDRRRFLALAGAYRLDMSEFMREMFEYFDANRPAIVRAVPPRQTQNVQQLQPQE